MVFWKEADVKLKSHCRWPNPFSRFLASFNTSSALFFQAFVSQKKIRKRNQVANIQQIISQL